MRSPPSCGVDQRVDLSGCIRCGTVTPRIDSIQLGPPFQVERGMPCAEPEGMGSLVRSRKPWRGDGFFLSSE